MGKKKKVESYNGEKPYIFVSYSHKDKNDALEIIKRLQEDGYRVWYDKGINSGTDWLKVIVERIHQCSFFLALVSPNYESSEYCPRERFEAFEKRKPMVLVYLKYTALPDEQLFLYKRYQALFKYDYRDENEFYNELYDSKEIGQCTDRVIVWDSSSDTYHMPPKKQRSAYSQPLTHAPKRKSEVGSIARKVLKVLLWIFFFPFMLIRKLFKSNLHIVAKLFLTALILPLISSGLVMCATILMQVSTGNGTSLGTVTQGDLLFEKYKSSYIASVDPNAKDRISGTVEIPSEVNGVSVIGIDPEGFADCTNITAVVVPDSVTAIGEGAFKGCDSLESLTIPFVGKTESAEKWEAVLGYIFGYEVVTKDESGYDLYGEFEFAANRKATSIPGETWQFTWVKYGEIDYYHYYIPESLKSVTVTKQTTIPDYAFNGCAGIETISFTSEEGKKLSIGTAAFQDCTDLKFGGENNGSLTIDNRFSTIGEYAYANCKNITDLVIANSVTTIGNAAFKGCDALQTLSIPFTGNTESAANEKAVLGYIFGYEVVTKEQNGHSVYGKYGCAVNAKPTSIPGETWQFTWVNFSETNFYHYYIPESLKSVTVTKQTTIPDYAFNGCAGIETISFTSEEGEKLSIGTAAFQDCTDLKFGGDNNGSLTIDNRFSTIGEYAYANCKNITDLVIADSVTTIGNAAFKGCDALQTLSIPFTGNTESAANEKAVLGYIFGNEVVTKEQNGHSVYGEYGCAVNAKPTSIPGETWQFTWVNFSETNFYYYYIPESLETVTVTKQTALPAYAFNGCSMLGQITLADGYEAGEHAFQDCSAKITEQ